MKIKTEITINAPKEKIWKVVTDFENSVNNISAIEKIEVLERPESGLVGFKWRETRIMFGKSATEVMWITDAVENEYYNTRAESHGSVYISTIAIAEQNGQSVLSMGFDGQPQTFGARVMGAIFGFMFKNATRKAIHKDLEDIKAVVEGS